MSNLILHAGAEAATREQVMESPTPEATDTHFPIPHATLIETVQSHIEGSGLTIEREEYGLFRKGARMFGVWTLANGVAMDDYGLAIGLRNAHDKAFAAGMAVGSHVFICDNLALSAEIIFARKHTKYIIRDLDRMVSEAVGRIGQARIAQDKRIAAYKATDLTDVQAHDLLIRAVDAQVMANSYIAHVLGEWREPQHEAFRPRNAWSLFNGFTEVFKRTNPLDLTERTVRLHGLMDQAAGIYSEDFGVDAATPDFT